MADHAPRVMDLNFNRPSAGQIASIVVGVLLIALLIAVLWTSYYTVEAESEGVVLGFGKFLKTVEPGLHFKLPLGIDAVTVVPIRRQLKLEFGFSTPDYTLRAAGDVWRRCRGTSGASIAISSLTVTKR